MSPNLPRPTDLELAILNVFRRQRPSTVRQVHEALGSETGYTTGLKLMQIMAEKGLISREGSERSHVYRAKLKEEQAQQQLVKGLMNRIFGGSAKKLVLRALSLKKASPEELAEIRALLDEGGKKP